MNMPGLEKTVKTLFLEYFLHYYCCHEQFDGSLLQVFEDMTIFDSARGTIIFLQNHPRISRLDLLKSLCVFVDDDELDIVDRFAHSSFSIGDTILWLKQEANDVVLQSKLLNLQQRF